MKTPSIQHSLLRNILKESPELRTQMYFRSPLVALCRAMADLVLAGEDAPVVIAVFPQERLYRQEIRRFEQVAQYTHQLYVLVVPDADSDLLQAAMPYETVALHPEDALNQEWHLVIVGQQYTACLGAYAQPTDEPLIEQARRFEGFWTFDRTVSLQAAALLLERIVQYRPHLAPQVHEAKMQLTLAKTTMGQALSPLSPAIQSDIFAQRLVTYLQATQYRLIKAYQALDLKQRHQRLINVITMAMRDSLNPQDVLSIAVREIGYAFATCRCILYRCRAGDLRADIEYEFVPEGQPRILGKSWLLSENPLMDVAIAQNQAVAIADATTLPSYQRNARLRSQIKQWQIRGWLVVPIRYQDMLLGMIELHHNGPQPHPWKNGDLQLMEGIASQAGVALSQADAYSRLVILNQQLSTIERTQRNLIAIVGHELRTPLTTIQVCLESLATEADMPPKVQAAMLSVALTDADRLRHLIKDFLTLSRLEKGQSHCPQETVCLSELVDLAVSGLVNHHAVSELPAIQINLPSEIPCFSIDAEGMVEVLSKLLNNACKFTPPSGHVSLSAEVKISSGESSILKIAIADTGCGIAPEQLNSIFEYFYQEEDALQRNFGGAGLGLAICRRIIQNMGGELWAESEGRDQGSQFYLKVPVTVLEPAALRT